MGITNLVHAIHDGHFKKIQKIMILQDISRSLPNLNKGVQEPQYFFKLHVMCNICMALMLFIQLGLKNSNFSI